MSTVDKSMAKAAAQGETTNQPKGLGGSTVAKKLPGPAKKGKLGNPGKPFGAK